MSDFDYAGYPAGDNDWFNPAIAEIMLGPRMRNAVRSVGYIAKALYTERSPRRTGRMASNVRVTTELAGANLGAKPDRWVAQVEAVTNYSAAVEFGRQNTAAQGNERPAIKRRVEPGQFPARSKGKHPLGGDNRRNPRAVVVWIESH